MLEDCRGTVWYEVGSGNVKFRSCFHEAPGCDAVSVDLRIRQSPLRALIRGGDERWAVASEKITLDGSLSYDPDVDNNAPSLLVYNWKCQVINWAFLSQHNMFKSEVKVISFTPTHTHTQTHTDLPGPPYRVFGSIFTAVRHSQLLVWWPGTLS